MSKTIKLQQLVLNHFKGVQYFTLKVNGQDAKVFGDNETGKTTTYDGFLWALFDKDSQNKKDFGIKTVDQDGKEQHYLHHEVEVTLVIDNKPLTLKKVFYEKYTKKRGSVSEEFSGHTTDYYIDGVPAKKKEYTDKVASIVDEDIFKLLTNPAYFNEQLDWKKRRDLLLEVAGDVSDDDVIASDDQLGGLPAILNGRSIEDHKKVIAAKKKEINKELERIPVRIDEARRSVPDTSQLNKEEIVTELDFLKTEKEAKGEEYNRIKNGSEVSKKQHELVELQGKQLDLENQHRAREQDGVLKLRQQLNLHQENLDDFKRKQRNAKGDIEDMNGQIKKKETGMAILRQAWADTEAKTFNFEEDTHCSLCGQALPEEKLASQKEDALAAFNKEKSEKLESIQNEGKKDKADKEALVAKVKAKQEEADGFVKAIELEQKDIDKLQEQIQKAQEGITDIQSTPDYQNIQKQREQLERAIQELKQSTKSALDKVTEEGQKIAADIEALQADLAKFTQSEQTTARIEELTQQQQELSAEFEQLEGEEYLANEFIKAKVNILESKINSKFEHARFKLFEPQINGGLQEVCETLYKGVPYNKGLNNAARINVGLDIIQTLSKHYGISAPIFIDNSEAVTKLAEIDSQVISLIVSEQDKQLRVETDKLQEAI
jgi:predicted  nucleic acid-binding Zn-ribbon protein